ncbi:MAG: DUF1206 domain-containing protein [Acidimicrobiales bacterium]
MGTKSDAGDKAEEAADSDAAERAGRGGLAARGAVYCLIALMCAAIVAGRDEGKVDQRGAIGALAQRGVGRALLVPLAIGFAGYAIWRGLRAVTARREGGSSRKGAKGTALRIGDGAKAIGYAALCASTIGVLIDEDRGSGEETQTWTATLLGNGAGRLLVGAAGVALAIGGAWLARRGWNEKFATRLRLTGWGQRFGPAVLGVGRFGYVARGIVLFGVGGFLTSAAIFQDSDEPVGVDATLRRVVDGGAPGRWAVAALAVGLGAFGLFSFVEARYRKVLDQ